MATVRVWFYSAWADGGASTLVPKEPPIGSARKLTVSTSNQSLAVPAGARFAAVETDAALAYRVNVAAVYADDPLIQANNTGERYAVDVAGASTLNLIAGA